MSEADSAPRRRPPTIDLTAKEVETGAQGPAAAPQADSAHAATSHDVPGDHAGLSRRATPYAVGGVIGAFAVAVVVAGALDPGFRACQPDRRATERGHDIRGASARCTGCQNCRQRRNLSPARQIQQALQARRPDTALEGRLTAAEAQTKALRHSLAALTRRVDDVAGGSQTALAQAKAAAVAAEAAKNAAQAGVQRADERCEMLSRISRRRRSGALEDMDFVPTSMGGDMGFEFIASSDVNGLANSFLDFRDDSCVVE